MKIKPKHSIAKHFNDIEDIRIERGKKHKLIDIITIHFGAFTLTGAVALTYYEVATIFTTVLGRSIHYTNPSIPIFIWHMLQQGFPLPFFLVMVGIYTTARFGLADLVTSDVQKLLNRSPIKIDRYVEDYREYWLSENLAHS